VIRRTIQVAETFDGRVGYGTAMPLRVRSVGTLTWLPAINQVISRGQELVRVNDRPVIVFYGTVPMFRDLGFASGSTQVAMPTATAGSRGSALPAGPTGAAKSAPTATLAGADVRELEQNLAALGYSGFTVDSTYSASTAAAVRRWQAKVGLPVTGVVNVGDIVFVAGPIRVAQLQSRVGDDSGATVLSATGMARDVSMDVPADHVDWAVPGTEVQIALPDGGSVAGRVKDIGEASGSGSSNPASDSSGGVAGGDAAAGRSMVTVSVELSDQSQLGALTSGPVRISHIIQEHRDVLVVPIPALVALAEGGYGLEVVSVSASRFVPVNTGLFADGQVEVSGPQVNEGMKVRLPK
jgi:peptidoglycan hydrolase-like protein with peptidoglycan-binding domain